MSPLVVLATITFPGLGHIVKGEPFKGAVFAIAFSLPLQGFLYSSYVWTRLLADWFPIVCLCLLIAVWGLAFYDIIRRTYFTDHQEIAREKARLFRSALISYLRGENEEAEATLTAALKFDREDPDLYFHLGAVLRSMGEKERAKRAFRKCISVDDNEKWRWELESELANLT